MEPQAISVAGTDWAVVFATIVGPIAAVVISLWNESRSDVRRRRYWVFSNLMATRGQATNFDHVRALNLILVEFSDYPDILRAWRAYMDHLQPPAATDEAWGNKRVDLLMVLLASIARAVGLKDARLMDMKYGTYSPQLWIDEANRTSKVQQVVLDIGAGKPIAVDVKR